MKEVRSPICTPKGPQAGNAGKLVKIKHAAIYNSDAGPSKLSPGGRRNLADPDPHPAASRTGGTISATWDTRK
jgi:hypothetical protein